MRYDRRVFSISFQCHAWWHVLILIQKLCYKKSANFFLPPLFAFTMVEEKSKKIMRTMQVLGFGWVKAFFIDESDVLFHSENIFFLLISLCMLNWSLFSSLIEENLCKFTECRMRKRFWITINMHESEVIPQLCLLCSNTPSKENLCIFFLFSLQWNAYSEDLKGGRP